MIHSKDINIDDTHILVNNIFDTPYESLTKSLNGGFKKGEATLFAGIEGSGLSMFISSLLVNILNQNNPIVFHVAFNDSPVKRKLNLALNNTKNEIANYNSVEVQNSFKNYDGKELIYNDEYLNTNQILEKVTNITIKNYPTIVIIEDLFNLTYSTEKNDFDLAKNISELINKLKRLDIVVICTTRLNGNIEKENRIYNRNFHHPIRSDVYNFNYIANSFNNIYAFHNPRLLNIPKYGIDEKDTKNLIHIKKLKTNVGKLSDIWLTSVLNKGHFVETNRILKNS